LDSGKALGWRELKNGNKLKNDRKNCAKAHDGKLDANGNKILDEIDDVTLYP
jgi:hypothetical protein